MPQQRRHSHRHDPRHQQRDRDHRKKREHEFARGVRRQTDPGKRHDPDDRGTQQGDLRILRRCIRGGDRGPPLAHFLLHTLGDDDGVIHQHPHGDDQGPKADPFNFDAEQIHEEERGQHGQQKRYTDNNRGADPHEQRKHPDHHAHGHGKRQKEAVVGFVHDAVLFVDRRDLYPDGKEGLQGLKLRFDAFADLDDIFRFQSRNAKGEDLLPVLTQKVVGGVRFSTSP